jgi:hypothetical protein
VRRSLGETLFKGVDGHLEIIAPLDQGPRQHWILDIRPVGNAAALFLGRDLAFDQLNGAARSASILLITAVSRAVSKRGCILIWVLRMT